MESLQVVGGATGGLVRSATGDSGLSISASCTHCEITTGLAVAKNDESIVESLGVVDGATGGLVKSAAEGDGLSISASHCEVSTNEVATNEESIVASLEGVDRTAGAVDVCTNEDEIDGSVTNSVVVVELTHAAVENGRLSEKIEAVVVVGVNIGESSIGDEKSDEVDL